MTNPTEPLLYSYNSPVGQQSLSSSPSLRNDENSQAFMAPISPHRDSSNILGLLTPMKTPPPQRESRKEIGPLTIMKTPPSQREFRKEIGPLTIMKTPPQKEPQEETDSLIKKEGANSDQISCCNKIWNIFRCCKN